MLDAWTPHVAMGGHSTQGQNPGKTKPSKPTGHFFHAACDLERPHRCSSAVLCTLWPHDMEADRAIDLAHRKLDNYLVLARRQVLEHLPAELCRGK